MKQRIHTRKRRTKVCGRKRMRSRTRRNKGGGIFSLFGMSKCSTYSKELEKRLVNQFNDKDWVIQKKTEYWGNNYKLSGKDITKFD